MNRFWPGLAIVLMAAVPIWTEDSAPVIVIEVLAGLFCVLGIVRHSPGSVTAGSVLALVGYAVALWSATHGVDVVGAAVLGLALLFLLGLGEFARRFHGAAVANEVVRTQTAYWLGRTAIIVGVVALLTLGGSVVASFVPGAGRAAIAGLGVIVAFAGALRGAIIRRPGGT